MQNAGGGGRREHDETHVDGFDDQQPPEHRHERLLPAPQVPAPSGDHPQQEQCADGDEGDLPREVSLPAVRELRAEGRRRPRLRIRCEQPGDLLVERDVRQHQSRPDRSEEACLCRERLPEQVHLARAAQARGRRGRADPDRLTERRHCLQGCDAQAEGDRGHRDHDERRDAEEHMPDPARERARAAGLLIVGHRTSREGPLEPTRA